MRILEFQVKMNINPATGEVTVMNSPTGEDRRKSLIQWEEDRRRNSIISRETTRGNTFKSMLPSLGEVAPGEETTEEDGENGAEQHGEHGDTSITRLNKLKHTGSVTAHLKTRLVGLLREEV